MYLLVVFTFCEQYIYIQQFVKFSSNNYNHSISHHCLWCFLDFAMWLVIDIGDWINITIMFKRGTDLFRVVRSVSSILNILSLDKHIVSL